MKKITCFFALLLFFTQARAQWSNTGPAGADYTKIRFTSPATAYARAVAPSGSASLIKTTTAGMAWSTLPFVPSMQLYDFFFLDDNTGFATADTAASGFPYHLLLYKTTDGGNTWIQAGTIAGAVPYESKMYFTDALHGIITETYGKIWYTANGGASWTMTDIGASYPQDIDFPTPSVGYVTCADGTFSYFGLVLKTTDGGATWNKVFDFSDMGLTYSTAGTVDFTDNNHGFMMTMNGFYETEDGGLTWNALPFAADNGLYFHDIYFQTELNAYACDAQGGIYQTSDGGHTWAVDRPADTLTWLYSIDIIGTQVYVAGSGGTILHKSISTGFNEQEGESPLQVYPNPSASGIFNLTTNHGRPLDITVLDQGGRVCLQWPAHVSSHIDCSELGSGVYLLVYHNEQVHGHMTLVK